MQYEVVHQMDGRLRLRIPRLASDAKFAQRVLDAATTLPAVEQARVNARSSSLVVTYRSGTNYISGNGRGPINGDSMLGLVVECVRAAADADAAEEVVSPERATTTRRPATNGHVQPPQAAHADSTVFPIGPAGGKEPINYAKRLGWPALSLGLSAGAMAGLAIPGVLIGGAILYAALPIFKRTLQGIRDEKKLTVEFLDSLTIVLMTAQASFLGPAFVVGVIESSEIVRDWTARRNREVNLSLVLSQEQQVLVERDGVEVHLPWEGVQPGDVVHVFPGDQIPVDGVIVEGSGLLDMHEMTGDSTPVTCREGDTVHASAIVTDGHLRIAATSVGGDTLAASLIALTEDASNTDTRVSNWARKTGNWAVLPTLATGGAVLATSGSLLRATSVTSLDFGVGMRVSAPIAVVSAQSYAAKNGILIRSGRALEMLAETNTVVFDKTAVVTENGIRSESSEVVAKLRDMGIGSMMLAEDVGEADQSAATALGIDAQHVHAGVLPHQKAELVQELKMLGRKVAVVGDGINDAAAMTYGDVAIALGSATDLARETADIVLLNDDLGDLITAIEIAKQTVDIIRQNQVLAVVPNVGTIIYGVLTALNPTTALLINNGTALVAALNSLRPLNGPATDRPQNTTNPVTTNHHTNPMVIDA